jgi:hypothetical protein
VTAACGGASGTAIDRNRAGTGSSTLLVSATVAVTNNAPALNSTAAANQPLDVSWTTPAMSKAATITTRNYSVTVPDTGAYTIPAANNPARTGQRVIVKRANEVEIARGLPGSILRATVTTTVDPFTVQ